MQLNRARLPVRRPRIGVVGGGQLARMLYQAALDLDLEIGFHIRPGDEGVAGWSPHVNIGTFETPSLLGFASGYDAITFEHELVPAQILIELEERGATIRPSATTMATTADKIQQRALFKQVGATAVPFTILNRDNTPTLPAIAKAATGGYDGRGVVLLETESALGQLDSATTWMIESVLPIEAELAVVTVTSLQGKTICYPAVRTRQAGGICVEVHWPTGLPREIDQRAESTAVSIAAAANVVGVLAVEFFLVAGELLVNEVAPRVHNSGHLTIEAARTSQFENHLRAVAGMPLGSTEMLMPASMLNLIGEVHPQGPPANGARIHLYGKTPRAGRKIGHLTAIAPDLSQARAMAAEAAARLGVARDGGSRDG